MEAGLPKGLYPPKRKAGLMGLGRIGFDVTKRLRDFDMDIAYSDVSEKSYAEGMTFIADPVKLAEHSDFLFVTLATSAATRFLLSEIYPVADAV